ncbi:MAG: hypothetical protein AABY75_01445 [Bacteroidota bacterium]
MQRILAFLLSFVVVGAAAQELSLTYSFKKGETIRTKETMTQAVTAEGMPGGGQMVKNVRYTSTAVNAVTKDGTADLVRSTDSSAMTLNEKPFTNPQASMAEKIAFRLKMDKYGKVLEAGPAEEPKDAVAKQLSDAMALQFKNSPGFPSRKVKVGEAWDDEVTNNQPTPNGVLTITVKTKTTVEKVDKMDGVDVAVLQMTGTLSGELGAGMGTITGAVKGTRYFAYKSGYELRSVIETDQTMDVQTPQGNMMMQTKMHQEKERMK